MVTDKKRLKPIQVGPSGPGNFVIEHKYIAPLTVDRSCFEQHALQDNQRFARSVDLQQPNVKTAQICPALVAFLGPAVWKDSSAAIISWELTQEILTSCSLDDQSFDMAMRVACLAHDKSCWIAILGAMRNNQVVSIYTNIGAKLGAGTSPLNKRISGLAGQLLRVAIGMSEAVKKFTTEKVHVVRATEQWRNTAAELLGVAWVDVALPIRSGEHVPFVGVLDGGCHKLPPQLLLAVMPWDAGYPRGKFPVQSAPMSTVFNTVHLGEWALKSVNGTIVAYGLMWPASKVHEFATTFVKKQQTIAYYQQALAEFLSAKLQRNQAYAVGDLPKFYTLVMYNVGGSVPPGQTWREEAEAYPNYAPQGGNGPLTGLGGAPFSLNKLLLVPYDDAAWAAAPAADVAERLVAGMPLLAVNYNASADIARYVGTVAEVREDSDAPAWAAWHHDLAAAPSSKQDALGKPKLVIDLPTKKTEVTTAVPAMGGAPAIAAAAVFI
jgi:hypothetical protein